MKRYITYVFIGSFCFLFIGLYIHNWNHFKPRPMTANAPEMHIAFGVNDTYAEPLETCITSLLWHNQNSRIYLYVLHESLSPEKRKSLAELTAPFPNSRISFIQTSIPNEFNNLLKHSTITKETFLRFSLPALLPTHVDKALYLDADIVINGPIQSFFDTPLQDHILAATPDAYKETYLSLLKTYGVQEYVNAGVLLLNLKVIREEHLLPEVYRFIQANLHNPRIKLADQDVINILWQQRTLIQDRIYNMDMRKISDKTGLILHYAGHPKPWYEMGLRNFYWAFYDKMKEALKNQDNPFPFLVMHQTFLDIASGTEQVIIKIIISPYQAFHRTVISPLSMMMLNLFY